MGYIGHYGMWLHRCHSDRRSVEWVERVGRSHRLKVVVLVEQRLDEKIDFHREISEINVPPKVKTLLPSVYALPGTVQR